jgi:hypothetical protein
LAALGLSAWRGVARELLEGLLRWRVHAGWYAFALLGPPILMLVAMAIHVALGGAWPDYPAASRWPLFAIYFVAVLLVGGPLGEELGWRGYALPRLSARVWASMRGCPAGYRLGRVAHTIVPVALLCPSRDPVPLVRPPGGIAQHHPCGCVAAHGPQPTSPGPAACIGECICRAASSSAGRCRQHPALHSYRGFDMGVCPDLALVSWMQAEAAAQGAVKRTSRQAAAGNARSERSGTG